MEASPPTAGHVYDGDVSQSSVQKDLDFQTHLDYLSAYWEGFNDPHSTIKEYYISIGTCPHCQDLLQHQTIGIVYGKTEMDKVDRIDRYNISDIPVQ